MSHAKAQTGKGAPNRKPYRQDVAQLSTKLDKHKRPEHKLVLLCGPAGLGKTTMAHVVATQAGYNVIEMNASDDRTLANFEERIEGALGQTRSLHDSARPNCLIIDEVDGAPEPSINYLLTLARDSLTRKKHRRVLRRPIICVCNDLYASALRELRKCALVLQVPGTDAQRLVRRLSTVNRHALLPNDHNALVCRYVSASALRPSSVPSRH